MLTIDSSFSHKIQIYRPYCFPQVISASPSYQLGFKCPTIFGLLFPTYIFQWTFSTSHFSTCLFHQCFFFPMELFLGKRRLNSSLTLPHSLTFFAYYLAPRRNKIIIIRSYIDQIKQYYTFGYSE